MTHSQFLDCTKAQRWSLQKVYRRVVESDEGTHLNFIDWLAERVTCGSPLAPYIGVQFCGMFLGIELDGYCHS